MSNTDSRENSQSSIRNSRLGEVVAAFWTRRSCADAWFVVGRCFDDDYFVVAKKDLLLELNEKDTTSDSAKDYNQTARKKPRPRYSTPTSSTRGGNRYHGVCRFMRFMLCYVFWFAHRRKDKRFLFVPLFKKR
jgi:hypothetical protein